VHAVLDAGAAEIGRSDAPLLPALPAAWFEARFDADDRFGDRPTIDGRPAEAGAIARTADHPAIAAWIARSGRTLLPRLLARLADMRAMVDAVERGAQASRTSPQANAMSASTGKGTGVADTARGRLAHSVTVVSGRVVSWRTVAPTEWSFHPRGVVREALLGAPADDLRRRARWIAAALDPCVPCVVGVSEDRDA